MEIECPFSDNRYLKHLVKFILPNNIDTIIKQNYNGCKYVFLVVTSGHGVDTYIFPRE